MLVVLRPFGFSAAFVAQVPPVHAQVVAEYVLPMRESTAMGVEKSLRSSLCTIVVMPDRVPPTTVKEIMAFEKEIGRIMACNRFLPPCASKDGLENTEKQRLQTTFSKEQSDNCGRALVEMLLPFIRSTA